VGWESGKEKSPTANPAEPLEELTGRSAGWPALAATVDLGARSLAEETGFLPTGPAYEDLRQRK